MGESLEMKKSERKKMKIEAGENQKRPKASR